MIQVEPSLEVAGVKGAGSAKADDAKARIVKAAAADNIFYFSWEIIKQMGIFWEKERKEVGKESGCWREWKGASCWAGWVL
jgi:hypothetical protein